MFTNSLHNFQKIKSSWVSYCYRAQAAVLKLLWNSLYKKSLAIFPKLHDLIVTTCVSFFQRSERVFSSKLKFAWRLCLRFDLTKKKSSFKIVSLPQHAFWKLINDFYDCCLLSLGFSRCRPNTTILSEILFKLSATGWSSNHQKEKRVLLRCCYSNLY